MATADAPQGIKSMTRKKVLPGRLELFRTSARIKPIRNVKGTRTRTKRIVRKTTTMKSPVSIRVFKEFPKLTINPRKTHRITAIIHIHVEDIGGVASLENRLFNQLATRRGTKHTNTFTRDIKDSAVNRVPRRSP